MSSIVSAATVILHALSVESVIACLFKKQILAYSNLLPSISLVGGQS